VKPAVDLQGIGILADSAAVSTMWSDGGPACLRDREQTMRRTQPHGEVIAGQPL